MTDFNGFAKIPRLSRECVITEKIDGTNASICITETEFLTGSRNRWITPDDDNYGFSAWAHENKAELLKLGVGHHFGEWWGCGINRGYDLPIRKFSVFNTGRWCLFGSEPKKMSFADKRIEKYQDILPKCVGLVPVLYRGVFCDNAVTQALSSLEKNGSIAAPGYMNPEGVVVYHIAGNLYFKKTIGTDGEKSLDKKTKTK